MRSRVVLLMAAFVVVTQAHADQWDYTSDADKMTGKASTKATITSSNSLDLPFPYGGANYGFLTVRKHPQYGLDVIVRITKGQILCPSYSGCSVKVRFGDGQPLTFSAAGAADHSSDILFIQNAQKFIDRAKKTTSIKVQMNIYQAGGQVLEFDGPSPLVWGQVQGRTTQLKSKEKPPLIP